MSPNVIPVIVGVDIGGTNTDVVLIYQKDSKPQVLVGIKELTTTDVTSGVKKAILRALLEAQNHKKVVAPIQVNIGTTHFVNAVVQGKDLAKVAVVRICGPVSEELPPFSDFPSELANAIKGAVYLIHGGYRFDRKEHESLDENQLRDVIKDIKGQEIKNIAFIGIFSPTRPDQEVRAREITLQEYPEATVTLSHEVGHIGLIERENAAILNECLKPLCKITVSGFKSALEEINVTCPFYLTQNDGTVISSEDVLELPVLTFASGPTNSIRGAAFLSNLKDAIVVDIGGTSADVGVLKNGFPREASTNVRVGGVRTNFRMPDVVSIGLGGGSYVQQHTGKDGKAGKVTIGPQSAGLNLKKEAYIFSDGANIHQRFLTATDVAVAAGLCHLGSSERVKDVDKNLVKQAVDEIHKMVEELIEKIKLSKEELPVIIVGGGSVLIDLTRVLQGTSQLIIPQHFGIANAIGAALSKVSESFNTVVSLLDLVDVSEMEKCVKIAVSNITNDPDGKETDLAINEARKPFFIKARDEAIENICKKVKAMVVHQGANPNTLEILEKQDFVISYAPGNATQIKVKVVGDLAVWESQQEQFGPWSAPTNFANILHWEVSRADKQTVTSTGKRLDEKNETERDFKMCPQDPCINPYTGEWILSEWDIECIVIGAGIYGCGGGGNPGIGRLRALKAIRNGKKMRVITPERLLNLAKMENENCIVMVSAFIGAPLIMYEQAVSSKETTAALECLRDVYEVGGFKDGSLQNMDGANVKTHPAGIKFIENYHPSGKRSSGYKIVALMSAEIGGMNAIEPFLIAANLDLPIVDGDGMSRAFPEVQMFIPYMFGNKPFPAAIAGSGNCSVRTALLYSPSSKLQENFLRDVSIANGCSAGMAIPLTLDEMLEKTALHTVSSAWRLGNAILRARLQKESVIDAIVLQEEAKHVMTGKILDVNRETSGGFNRGSLVVEGVDKWLREKIHIDFQNENLVILSVINGELGPCLGCTPDLICIVDADTAEPITVEEIKYGLRVAVLLMPSHEHLRHPKSLRWVGPQAFHYHDIEFKPFWQRKITIPVPPV